MGDQERWREQYARIRPAWSASTSIYTSLIRVRVEPGTRVLDVGCGHSDLLAEVFSLTPHVVGVDPDAGALKSNATIRRTAAATAEALPFADASFDLVLLAWVLEHLERPGMVFREIRRVLAPGGEVLFVTPNAWNYNAWLIRLVPNAFHAFFTRKLYGREASDTYPTRYRMNSVRRIHGVLSRLGYERRRLILNGDPTYIAFNAPLFRVATWLERIFDLPGLRLARVHIIGVYRNGGVSGVVRPGAPGAVPRRG